MHLSILNLTLILSIVMSLPASAQGLNEQLEQAVSAEQWSRAIEIIDQMIQSQPDPQKELAAYRSRLVGLASKVQILDREQVDGVPLTIGETVTLKAEARDERGQDVSSQIQWTDRSGRVLGLGRELIYPATQPQNETIIARIGENRDLVTFMVSPAHVSLAPHLKVLADDVKQDVIEFSLEQGVLILRDTEALPSLKQGDIVIGAEATVPPVRILRLQTEANQLRMQVTPITTLKELILEVRDPD